MSLKKLQLVGYCKGRNFSAISHLPKARMLSNNKSFLLNCPETDGILHKCYSPISSNVFVNRRGHFHGEKPFKTILFVSNLWLPESNNWLYGHSDAQKKEDTGNTTSETINIEIKGTLFLR